MLPVTMLRAGFLFDITFWWAFPGTIHTGLRPLLEAEVSTAGWRKRGTTTVGKKSAAAARSHHNHANLFTGLSQVSKYFC